jgi:probable phosphoglycerate mutase
MELLMIRHGLPVRLESADGGPADPPLTELGKRQARCVASWLACEAIDRIYASPLRRAHETAMHLAELKGVEIDFDLRLREWDHESAIYIPLEELKVMDPETYRALLAGMAGMTVDMVEFRRGVVSCIEQIIGANRGRRVAIVCHGGVINAWASHVLGIERHAFFQPDYASINRFMAASSGERSVASLNEMGHMRELCFAEATSK